MGNCLKTQLKGIVNNNTLKVFGEIEIEISANTISDYAKQQRFVLKAKSGETIKVFVKSGNGHIATSYANLTNDPKTEIIVGTNYEDIWFENINMVLGLTPVYNIAGFQTYSRQNLVANISFNVKDIEFATEVESFDVRYTTTISGNIANLGRMTALTSVGLALSGVTGALEDFVSKQVESGKSSNTTGITWPNITRFNETLGGLHFETVSGLLTWESASKIAVYNANTISGATDVYVKGYSATEIAEKTASGGLWEGKTVTQC